MTAAAFWCEAAWIDGGVVREVLIETASGVITAVAPDTERPERGATEMAGLTLPGLANTHSHVFHRALRGRTHEGSGTFWEWRDAMYALAAGLDPRRYRELATAVFAEMAQAGYTVVGEFHYLHHGPGGTPYDDPNAMGAALVEAATAVGIRLTLLDACYLEGGFGDEGHVTPTGAQSRFDDGSVETWLRRTAVLDGSERLRPGAAIHSVRAVAPAAMRRVAKVARERGLPLHMHVAEQPGEIDGCRSAYGVTPVRLLAENGILSEEFTAVHAVHLDDEELDLLADHGAGVCLCPTTERDLADGTVRSAVLAGRGIPLSLGSDSHAVVDPFEEMRTVELDTRAVTHRRGTHPPASLLEMGGPNGYRALGWPQGGHIATGGLADLVSIGFDSVRLAGTSEEHLPGTVVFAATGADVDTVVVHGEVIVRDGAHVAIDVAGELYGAIGAAWG